MNKLKISGVAKGQYKQLCPISTRLCKQGDGSISYKIRRAVDLGKVTHVYNNGCKIVRYYYLNFLISDKEIMTMWRDKNTKPYDVPEKRKELHKQLHKEGYSYSKIREVLGIR